MTCFARRRRLTKAAVLGAVVIASAACLAQGRTIGPDPFRGTPAGSSGGPSEIDVRVRNSNFNEATIYTIRFGSRRRLGRVQGATDADFKVPWPIAGQLRFEVDLLASRGCSTRNVVVEPGQTVLLTIDSNSRPRSSGQNSLCDVQRGR
jgi:hypothetical protein